MIGLPPLNLFSLHNPFAILPDALVDMHSRTAPAARVQWNENYELEDKPILTVEDGIGSVSITGPLMRKPSLFAQVVYGATDFDEIVASLENAANDPGVRAILLEIDSPGGTVNGTPEVAQAVREAARVKPVYAFTQGLMASAAYWIGSQADAVYATPSAMLGSIGVIVSFLDVRGALEGMGYKMEVFSSGKFKGMGLPGTSLTDEQREHIQARIEETANEFKAAVRARGRKIPDEAMEGQVFYAREAQKYNLAGTVKNRAEVVARLSALARSGRRAA
ncbi:S49 family peptidase [Verrucomicrobium sp. BvORR106]|uniref:S49 family peptidase n=1 Tax=Verrucomicrobium sp. BvORR106 TaxID=1403819 RepID=UPI000690F85C|nr:S49 family peptidase [Verrucomicrobium sp. BvORR106]